MSRRILVVEDSRTQAEQLKAVLEDGGYQVDVATDGQAGLAALETRLPDAIISDIVMPGAVDGYELCRQVKTGLHRDLPVLLLTSLSDPTDIIRALECGADNFLRKPCEPKYLMERLGDLFTTREIRAKDRVRFGMKVMFLGREVTINAEHQQVLDLLIATFEDAVVQNRELRQREEELRIAKAKLDRYAGALELRLKSVLDTIPDVLFSVDASFGNLFYISPAARLVFGYAPDEMLADPELWRRSIHGEDLPGVLAAFNKAVDTNAPQTAECRISTRAGNERWLELSVAAVPDDVHGGIRLDGVAHDVTDRKCAEEALIASGTRFRSLIEHSMDQVTIMGADGRFTYASPGVTRLLGYDPDELVGQVGFGYVHPDDVARVQAAFARALQGDTAEVRETFRFRHKDGFWRAFESVVTNLLSEPTVAGLVINSRDVTDRSRAEEALRQEQFLVNALMDNIPDSIYFKDLGHRFVRIGRAMARLFGLSDPAQAVGKTDVDFFSMEHAQAAQLTEQEITRTGQPVVDLEELETWPDRPSRWVSTTKMPLRDAAGSIVGTYGISRDITERRKGEELVRQSEAEYRGLVEQAPLGICRTTCDGHALRVNKALVAMLGYDSADDLLQVNARDFYADPLERDREMGQLEYQGEAHVETEWKRKDGSLVTVRLNMRLVRDAAGAGGYIEGLIEDVTEQRSLENQFRQAQRLEAVGRLAGGVAHDFNNVLTAITGYSELLLDELTPGDPKRQDVEEIHAAARRAAGLTRQLLAFSRKQVFQTRVLDLNAVVRMLEKMLQRLIGEDVKLEIAPSSALGAVRADPGQIEQVIMNLAVNSRDAMPGGGRLTIETANVDLDEAYAREHAGAAPGRYVMLAVSDTGTGMDAETQSHIFEPFFTTKEQGTGTGLGLATVYGIVKQSGGHVWVYSEPGRGATFKIYLPRVDEPVEAQDAQQVAPPVAGGRETVLVAEDDPSVREIVAEVLTQKGYRVLRAPDGQTALEMARAQPGEIQLLVTDIVMPGMTGRELAEVLVAERAGVRVLYMSGYTDDAVVRHGVLAEGLPYLQKPFSPRALALKVREVLDRASVAAGA
ncbi:MAG: PAS domain S-box protein [Gemmatimonadales bacterium]|jgi:PAS domain S-box-containing protein